MRKIVIFSALLICGCSSVGKEYVAADRATYSVIAPELRKYHSEDSNLSDETKARWERLLNSWDLRIRAEESK
jgi:uncharacterized protein YceK